MQAENSESTAAAMNEASIHFKGICEPRNPSGVIAWGYVIEVNGEAFVGGGSRPAAAENTNNRAAYFGLGVALKKLQEHCAEKSIKLDRLRILGDSTLVISQVSGTAKINESFLRKCQDKIAEQLAAIIDPAGVSIQWIPRGDNNEANSAARRAYAELTGFDAPSRL